MKKIVDKKIFNDYQSNFSEKPKKIKKNIKKKSKSSSSSSSSFSTHKSCHSCKPDCEEPMCYIIDNRENTIFSVCDCYSGQLRALNGLWALSPEFDVTENGAPVIPQMCHEGAGSRMFYWPPKNAFRIGSVSADQWNENNVGNLSFASGKNVEAGGTGSSTFGYADDKSLIRNLGFGSLANGLARSSFYPGANIYTDPDSTGSNQFGNINNTGNGYSMLANENSAGSLNFGNIINKTSGLARIYNNSSDGSIAYGFLNSSNGPSVSNLGNSGSYAGYAHGYINNVDNNGICDMVNEQSQVSNINGFMQGNTGQYNNKYYMTNTGTKSCQINGVLDISTGTFNDATYTMANNDNNAGFINGVIRNIGNVNTGTDTVSMLNYGNASIINSELSSSGTNPNGSKNYSLVNYTSGNSSYIGTSMQSTVSDDTIQVYNNVRGSILSGNVVNTGSSGTSRIVNDNETALGRGNLIMGNVRNNALYGTTEITNNQAGASIVSGVCYNDGGSNNTCTIRQNGGSYGNVVNGYLYNDANNFGQNLLFNDVSSGSQVSGACIITNPGSTGNVVQIGNTGSLGSTVNGNIENSNAVVGNTGLIYNSNSFGSVVSGNINLINVNNNALVVASANSKGCGVFGALDGTSNSMSSSVFALNSKGSVAIGYCASDKESTTVDGVNGALVVGRDVNNRNNHSLLVGQYGDSLSSKFGDINNGIGTVNPATIFGVGSIQIAGGSDNLNKDISVIIGTSFQGSPSIGGGIANFWYVTGADYAEYFEINNLDEFIGDPSQPTQKDPVGYFVTLKNDKIAKATSTDYIVGITSAKNSMSGFVGDCAELKWNKAILRDEFGRTQFYLSYLNQVRDLLNTYKIKITPEISTVLETDNETLVSRLLAIPGFSDKFIADANKLVPMKITKQNPDYNKDAQYIPRSARDEWCPVALMGKVYVRQDGTCVEGKRCDCNNAGIATYNENGKYWVLNKVNDNVVRVLLK